MREIKFRAWHCYSKKMFEVRKLTFFTEDTMLIEGYNVAYGLEDEGADEDICILMQFTGRLDKNKKEIYEGDIVIDKNGVKSVIEFENECFVGKVIGKNEFCAYNWRECKIIGNKCENLELIYKL